MARRENRLAWHPNAFRISHDLCQILRRPDLDRRTYAWRQDARTLIPKGDNLASIEGFERIGRVQLYAYNDRLWQGTLGPDASGESYDLRFEAAAGRLVISAQDGAALEFDLQAYVKQLSEQGSSRAAPRLSEAEML